LCLCSLFFSLVHHVSSHTQFALPQALNFSTLITTMGYLRSWLQPGQTTSRVSRCCCRLARDSTT
jgi:hypothetical protein